MRLREKRGNKIISFVRLINSLLNSMAFLETNLVYHSSYHSTSSTCSVDVTYLDFSKGFDTVPHNELLLKLRKLGITGLLWSWFQAYLKGRYHYVMIDGAISPLLPAISGVPQGSILGPLLFLIYQWRTQDLLKEGSVMVLCAKNLGPRPFSSVFERSLLSYLSIPSFSIEIFAKAC